ncbi:TonB-dependent hemoglobin/transferrin/lactoferrin family receptor [Caenispirillum bisanense]|uniref:Hemoglobin/transferrin/lactoferrin receptor protein n=1 Tax=Caenispirillum bisanense TaxID=414052 RepID=A0A286GRK4_9PROT|nr:TonB-dependent hemoglobin/transferrin/lactoferrin family receptor [Caenispirillum bisanense]SOD98195.1 hemoglobin/transferrin/lactoferrin receptor protein [Caenispirillum bisanense]
MPAFRTLLAGSTAVALVLALPVMAEAEEAAAPASIVLDPVMVSAERTEKRPVDSLAPVSVRTSNDFARFQPLSAGDLLDGVPGVTTSVSAVSGPGTKIGIRGMENFGRVNVMVDGARQNFQRSSHGENTMVFIDPELIGQVDVVRGPSAAIYGSGAVGGVVNFRTKDAADLLRPGETFGASLTGTVGTNGDGRRGTATAYGAVDWADVVVSTSLGRLEDYEDGDGTKVVNSGWDQQSALAKLTLTPNDSHMLRVSLIHNKFDFESGTATVDDLTTTANTVTGTYHFTPEDTPLVDLTVNAYYTTTEQEETRISGSPLGRETRLEVETPGFDVFNTSRFDLGGTGHALTVGVDGFQDTVEATRAGGPLEFTPAGERRVLGAFIQDEIALTDRWSLVGALRFDDYTLESGALESSDNAVSPKVTLGYELLDGITAYGSWANAFRAPSITETLINGSHPPPASFRFVPNPNLQPETAENWEVGLNVAQDDLFLPQDKLRLKASVYQASVDDYIAEYFNLVMGRFGPNFAASTYGYENIPEAHLRGGELELSYDAGFAYAGLSLSRARGKNAETGERLQSGLGDHATLTIGARDRDNGLDFGWRFTGRRDLDVALPDDPTDAADDPAGGYLLHTAYVSYTPPQLDDAVTLRLTVDNIFDTTYQTTLANQEAEPGRTVLVSGTIRF